MIIQENIKCVWGKILKLDEMEQQKSSKDHIFSYMKKSFWITTGRGDEDLFPHSIMEGLLEKVLQNIICNIIWASALAVWGSVIGNL